MVNGKKPLSIKKAASFCENPPSGPIVNITGDEDNVSGLL